MDYARARLNMVESQLRTNKVTDPGLVEAFESIARESFVPEASRAFAYVDEDIACGDGRYVMEPMVLARLLQSAEIAPSDVVLDVGAGTGYASAILSRLAATVVALEDAPERCQGLERRLAESGADNVLVVQGALSEGFAKQAPYDVILVNGGVEEVPEALIGQLAEGGRLLCVLREDPRIGRAVAIYKTDGIAARRVLFDALVPLLPGFERERGFVF